MGRERLFLSFQGCLLFCFLLVLISVFCLILFLSSIISPSFFSVNYIFAYLLHFVLQKDTGLASYIISWNHNSSSLMMAFLPKVSWWWTSQWEIMYILYHDPKHKNIFLCNWNKFHETYPYYIWYVLMFFCSILFYFLENCWFQPIKWFHKPLMSCNWARKTSALTFLNRFSLWTVEHRNIFLILPWWSMTHTILGAWKRG